MKKAAGAGLLLLCCLLLSGCGETAEQRQYKAVNLARDFNMAILDYQHRTSADDIRGLDLATEAVQAIVKQELKTPEEVAVLKGQKLMPEVVNVSITEATPIGKDGAEGFIVNTRIIYYPNTYHYVDTVGLKVIPIPGGEWRVDNIKFGEEL